MGDALTLRLSQFESGDELRKLVFGNMEDFARNFHARGDAYNRALKIDRC